MRKIIDENGIEDKKLSQIIPECMFFIFIPITLFLILWIGMENINTASFLFFGLIMVMGFVWSWVLLIYIKDEIIKQLKK